MGAWEEIIHIIAEILNPTYQTINLSAAQDDIENLEKELGLVLPISFKKYLSVCNGQKNQNLPLLGYHYFLSTTQIVETWSMMNQLFAEEIKNKETLDWVTEDKIKPVIWSHGWIPFSDFESSTRLILDLSPGKNGTLGQVFLYQPGMNYQELIADSFDDFTFQILERLKRVEYSINDNVLQFDDLYI